MASDPVSGHEGPTSEPPEARAQIASLVFALLLLDHEGCVVEINHAAENLLGTSAKRILGRPLTEFIVPLDDRVLDRL
ncbi:MAG: PAS domain-containing protein, partial [Pseudomonadota bacterium]